MDRILNKINLSYDKLSILESNPLYQWIYFINSPKLAFEYFKYK